MIRLGALETENEEESESSTFDSSFLDALDKKMSLIENNIVKGTKTFSDPIHVSALLFNNQLQNTAYTSSMATLLSGLTNNVQTQINDCVLSSGDTLTGNVSILNASTLTTNGDIIVTNSKKVSTPYLNITVLPTVNYVYTYVSPYPSWLNYNNLLDKSSLIALNDSNVNIYGVKTFSNTVTFNSSIQTFSAYASNLTTCNSIKIEVTPIVDYFLKCTNTIIDNNTTFGVGKWRSVTASYTASSTIYNASQTGAYTFSSQINESRLLAYQYSLSAGSYMVVGNVPIETVETFGGVCVESFSIYFRVLSSATSFNGVYPGGTPTETHENETERTNYIGGDYLNQTENKKLCLQSKRLINLSNNNMGIELWCKIKKGSNSNRVRLYGSANWKMALIKL